MGRMLVREVLATPGCGLAGGTEQPGSPALGRDLGQVAGGDQIGLAIGTDAATLIGAIDALLDFTAPAASVAHARLCARHGTAHVIGTTGLATADTQAIREAARETAIVQAGNMSLGVNLLVRLAGRVARALGEEFDVEIVEMHHRHKVDAPSGTALMLGRAVAGARGQDHDRVAQRGRDGLTGERAPGAIGYAALRGGNVVGEHTVIFAAADERVELTHKAGDRAIFARGAVRAALWTRDRPPGHYDMIDVLGLAD